MRDLRKLRFLFSAGKLMRDPPSADSKIVDLVHFQCRTDLEMTPLLGISAQWDISS